MLPLPPPLSPPMGWNSWDCYGAGINEEQLLGNAGYMAENLKTYGWEYVVCDIEWSDPLAFGNRYNNFADLCMDEYSRLIPSEERFPSAKNGVGFAEIADKIHGMGLKFGIHILRGIPRQAVHMNTATATDGVTARSIAQSYSVCPWNTSMYGVDMTKRGAQEYYNSLFELYASWGVDFVKIDDISNTEFLPSEPYSAKKEIEAIKKAVVNCGREMIISLSPGPAPIEFAHHLSQNANMWRMSGDFWDNTDALKKMFRLCEKWYAWSRPGAWPDCDMLPLGILQVKKTDKGYCGRKTNFTENEQKSMLTLWSIFRSPLILGGELRETDEFTLSLITNEDILSLNRFSHSQHPILCESNSAVWSTIGNDGKRVFAYFSLSDEKVSFELPEELLLSKAERFCELWTKAVYTLNDIKKLELSHFACAVFKEL